MLKKNTKNGRTGISGCRLEYCAGVGDTRCVTVFLGWIWVGAKVGVCTLGFTLCLGQSNNAGWVVFFNNAPIYKQLKSVVSKPLSIGWRTRWINNKKGIEHTSREPHNLLSFDEYPIHTQVRP